MAEPKTELLITRAEYAYLLDGYRSGRLINYAEDESAEGLRHARDQRVEALQRRIAEIDLKLAKPE